MFIFYRLSITVAVTLLLIHCNPTTSSSSSYIPEFISDIILQYIDPIYSVKYPPNTPREEDRYTYAGVPPGWNSSLPRQAINSTNKLIDPPNKVPDPYGWLRDDNRTNTTILEYLKSEKEYTNSITSHLKELQSTLYKEMLAKVIETDYSTPYAYKDYWYYSRTFKGLSYSNKYRVPKTSDTLPKIEWNGSKDSPILKGETVYLDVNKMAKNRTNCDVNLHSISPSQKLVAYLVDYSGSETYEVHIRDINTGKDVKLTHTAGGNKTNLLHAVDFVWGKDDTTFYYVTEDDAKRANRLYARKDWNTTTFKDKLLKEETDVLFSVGVSKSKDEKHIYYNTDSEETSETWYMDISSDESTDANELKIISPRLENVQYSVSNRDKYWYFVTDLGDLTMMKWMRAPITSSGVNDWELVKDGKGEAVFDGKSPNKSLDDVSLFKSHAVLTGREDGIPAMWVYTFETKELVKVEFEDSAYTVGLGSNEYDVEKVTIVYESMLTPPSVYDMSLKDVTKRSLVRETKIPGYNKDLYITGRFDVLSRDGKAHIPVDYISRKDVMAKAMSGEKIHVHMYGYGAYEDSLEADFDTVRLPLIDRGIVYAIAHVRGGGELGRAWYEEPTGGKLLCKKNTFNDFVDVAKFLIANWTTPDMLSIEGRSAGGLLIGASINQAPELFRVALLGRPFVDAFTTMTDSSIPLTSGEWIEWGNPNEEKYSQYMLSYSPVNNVQKGKKYPSCWLTAGLHDPRVGYWEPLKMAASLRHTNPYNPYPVIYNIDLEEGHFDAGDRYKSLNETAADYAFLLGELGLTKPIDYKNKENSSYSMVV